MKGTLNFAVLSIALFLAAFIALPGRALALTYFSDDEAIVTGVITATGPGTFTIDTGEALFDVSLDNLDIDASFARILRPGSKVAVRGTTSGQALGNPVIDARRVLMISSNMSELAASELLLQGQTIYSTPGN